MKREISPAAHFWIEIVLQGLSDLFFVARTQEQEIMAIEATEEVRRLYLEAAK